MDLRGVLRPSGARDRRRGPVMIFLLLALPAVVLLCAIDAVLERLL